MTQLLLPGLEDEAVRYLVLDVAFEPRVDEDDRDYEEVLTLQEWLDKAEDSKLDGGGSKDPSGIGAYINLDTGDWKPEHQRHRLQVVTRYLPFLEALGSPPELAELYVPEGGHCEGYLPMQGRSPSIRLDTLSFLDHQGSRHSLGCLQDIDHYTVIPELAEQPERVLFEGYHERSGIGATLVLPLHATEGKLHLRVRPAKLRDYWIDAIRYRLTSSRDFYTNELAKHQSLLDKRDALITVLADFDTRYPTKEETI